MAANFSLTGSLRLSPVWVEPLDASTVTDATTALVSLSLANGTGTGQADAYWRDLISVGAASTTTINLTALPMNVFGTAGTLDTARQKLLLIRNRSTTLGLTIALGTSATAALNPGGMVLATSTANGWAETALTLANAGGSSVSVEVYLVGVKRRTLYFNGAVSGNWATAGNWWLDAAHTVPAAGLPQSVDSVVIADDVTDNTGGAIQVRDLTVESASFEVNATATGIATFNAAILSSGFTLTGNAVFTGNGVNQGTVSGNATFNDSSANLGSVGGDATFNDTSGMFDGNVTGTATFTGSACNDGGQAGQFVPDPPPSC
jgi:hypothetical protein